MEIENYSSNTENKEILKTAEIKIEPSGIENIDKKLEENIKKYNLPDIISQKTGLSWKKNLLNIKHDPKGTGDWENDDTIIINYNNKIWCLSTIAHELVHLILRQNNWTNNEVISEYIKNHSELKNEKRGDGYPLEQMVAYLIQAEIVREIGEKEKIEEMMMAWDEQKFEDIIKKGYKTDYKNLLAKTIILEWKKKKETNILKWIEDLINQKLNKD